MTDQCFETLVDRLDYLARVAKTNVMGNALNRASIEITQLNKDLKAANNLCAEYYKKCGILKAENEKLKEAKT